MGAGVCRLHNDQNKVHGGTTGNVANMEDEGPVGDYGVDRDYVVWH